MNTHTHHIFAGDIDAVCGPNLIIPAQNCIEGKPLFHNTFSNGMNIYHVEQGEVFAVPFLTAGHNLEYYLNEDWFIYARDCMTGAHYSVCTELWDEWDYEAMNWAPVLKAAEENWSNLDWQPVFGNCQASQEQYYQFHRRWKTLDKWLEHHKGQDLLMAAHELPYKERYDVVQRVLAEHRVNVMKEVLGE